MIAWLKLLHEKIGRGDYIVALDMIEAEIARLETIERAGPIIMASADKISDELLEEKKVFDKMHSKVKKLLRIT